MARIRIYQPETIRRRLPPVCMQCGARADDYLTKNFSWYPPWVIVFIFCGLLPLVIIALIMTKRMTVECPLCDEHRNHWAKRSRFTWLGFFGVLVLGVGFIIAANAIGPQNNDVPIDGILGFSWVGIFLIWLVAAAIYQQSAIRPEEITIDDITFVKLSPDFVDALEDDRDRRDEERRERRALDRENGRDCRGRDDRDEI